MKPEEKTAYWDGAKNKVIRYFFYVITGTDVYNLFRNIVWTILAVYFALKFECVWLIPLMFLVCLPILLVVGYIKIFHMNKVMDFLNIHFSTHYSKYGYELQEQILAELKKLNKEI